MPLKRILTKKGVVPSLTVVSQSVNSIPEVVPASSTRVTRIPIPRGTKVPVAAVKPSTQQHKHATVANTTAVTTAATTNNIVTDSISSAASLITSTTGSLADWAIDFQVQLRAMNSRFASYETRLNEVERLTAENSQLKLALSDAHQLIATLQAEVKQLSSVPHDTVMSDVSGSSSGAVFDVCSGAPGGTSGDSGDSSGVSVGVSTGLSVDAQAVNTTDIANVNASTKLILFFVILFSSLIKSFYFKLLKLITIKPNIFLISLIFILVEILLILL